MGWTRFFNDAKCNKIIKNINTRKATVPDIIPGKGIKLAVRVFDFNVSNMINNNLARNSFSEPSKIAC